MAIMNLAMNMDKLVKLTIEKSENDRMTFKV